MNLRLSGAVLLLVGATLSVPLFASASTITSAAVVALTNADRSANGSDAVAEDTRLDTIAQKKAADMLARGYFSHDTPDGKNPWSWLISENYYYYFAGENLAMGFASAQSLEQAWMHSPTHRSNIVNPIYTRVGIGTASGAYLGKQTTVVVEFFATPPSATALAGTKKSS